MKVSLAIPLNGMAGVMLTLLSTFVGERSALALYPDIMGCEAGCYVVATGWPLIFVRDYLGMSVVGTAHILEVWFAADEFAWPPFMVNVAVWSLVSLGAGKVLHRVLLSRTKVAR